MPGENTKIYTSQGGATQTFASGATLSAESGSAVTLAGTNTIVRRAQSKAANYTVTAADSDSTFIATAADVVFTLPSTSAGLRYTFVTGALSTGTGTSISPAAADKIMGSVDGPTAITSADDKDLINSGASDVLGDSVTLIGDGLDGWFIVGCTGVWAREA